MRFFSSASALSLLSFVSSVFAQEADADCPYKPVWAKCTGAADYECATIQVPKNWYNEAAGVIPLRLIRIPSTTPNAESIIYNPGGPGGSGIDSILEDNGYLRAVAGPDFHIVSFDPRGVGLNMPYKCAVEGGFSVDYSKKASFTDAYNFFAGAAKTCDDNFGDLGSIISTTFVARDVDTIARAVGVDKLIRYWGFSYGTLLGDTIAKMFPLRVAAMVLDGNINPNDYYFDFPVEEATDIDRAIENFFGLCALAVQGTGQCAWATTGAVNTNATLIKKWDDWVGADPTLANRGRASTSKLTIVDSWIVRNLLFDGLKNPSDWTKLAQILEYWYRNPGQIRQFKTGETVSNYVIPAGALNKRQIPADQQNYNPNDAKTVITPKAINGIACGDSSFRERPLDGTVYSSYLDKYNQKTKYAGDLSISGLWNCAPWITEPVEPLETRFGGTKTLKPILFVQTPYDPVTPEISGERAAQAFDNAVIFKHAGAGHCSNAHQSGLLNGAIQTYWNLGTFPPANARQFFPTAPNPFVVQQPAPPPTDNNQERDPTVSKRDVNGLPWYASLWESPAEAKKLKLRQLSTTRAAPSTTPRAPSTTPSIAPTTSSSTITSASTSTSSDTGSTTSYSKSLATAPSCDDDDSSTSTTMTSTKTGSTTKGTGKPTSVKASTTPGRSYQPSTFVMWEGWTEPSPTSVKPSWSDYYSVKTTTSSAYPGWTPITTKPVDPWAPITTTKPVDPWSPITSTKPADYWDPWTSQADCVPVTKTVCPDNGDCKVTVYAIPTKTVYVDYVVDVCETGLVTKTVTVTATCDKGCEYKPTGIPQGYTTTNVYCSACATPSTVLVTVKVTEVATATWSPAKVFETGKATIATASWLNVPSTSVPVKPATTSPAVWAPVATYKGAATTNTVAAGGLLVVIFAALLLL